jgi:hypothetical protein
MAFSKRERVEVAYWGKRQYELVGLLAYTLKTTAGRMQSATMRDREKHETYESTKQRGERQHVGSSCHRSVGRESKARGKREREGGHCCLPFSKARKEYSCIDSGAGGHKLRYEWEGEKGRAGVRHILPATGPRGVVGRRSPINS